jgi:hypothetical protein
VSSFGGMPGLMSPGTMIALLEFRRNDFDTIITRRLTRSFAFDERPIRARDLIHQR